MTAVQTIDWNAIGLSLAASRARLEQPLSPERKSAILAERGRQLNLRSDSSTRRLTVTRMLCLRIGGESWCLRLAGAGAIFRVPRISPIPGAGKGIAGIVLRQGRIVTLIDLPVLLGCGKAGANLSPASAVELRGTSPSTALLVDAIDGAVELELGDLEKVAGGSQNGALTLGIAPGGLNVIDDEALAAMLTARGDREAGR